MKVNNNLIKGRMKQLGISPSEMAELLGCNTQNVYNMLTKKEVPMFTQRLVLICKALEIDMIDVFELEGSEAEC